LNERGVAAPVEEQDALLALAQPVAERPLELLAHDRAQPVARVALGASRRRSARLAPIDHFDGGQSERADAFGKGEQAIAPALRVRPALEARRGAAEDDDGTLLFGAHERDLARMIARRLALLVARLVLLVDHDRADVLERRKDRGPRTDGDALASLAKGEPFVITHAVAERAVKHRDLIAEQG